MENAKKKKLGVEILRIRGRGGGGGGGGRGKTLLIAVNIVQSCHDALDSLAAELPLITHIHQRRGIILPDDAPSLLLHKRWGLPRRMDVFRGEILEFGNVGLDVASFQVHLLADQTGIVALDLVAEEATAGTLHPAHRRHREFKVQHKLLEELLPVHPRDPEVASSQEYRDALSGQEVSPPFLSALADHGVDPRIAGLSLSPHLEVFGIVVPGELDAERVAVHGVKLGRGGADEEGKLAQEKVLGELLEQDLSSGGGGGKLPQLGEQLARREAAEAGVGAQGVFAHQPVDGIVGGSHTASAEA